MKIIIICNFVMKYAPSYYVLSWQYYQCEGNIIEARYSEAFRAARNGSSDSDRDSHDFPLENIICLKAVINIHGGGRNSKNISRKKEKRR